METIQSPFEIFPSEIWMTILEELDNSSDVKNITNTYPQIRTLIQGKEFLWLMGEVMPIILTRYLDISDIKNCRLVSKRWRYSVNIILESHGDSPPYKPYNSAAEYQRQNKNCHPVVVTNFGKFVRSFNMDEFNGVQSATNPFPGRYVQFTAEDEFCEGNEWDRRMSAAELLLKQFGCHVWYCCISIYVWSSTVLDVDVSQAVGKMFRYLQYLPNLKYLKLETNLHSVFDILESDIKFSQFFKYTTFPFRLDTLDLLDMEPASTDYYFHEKLFNTFVNHNGVKKLKMNCCYWSNSHGCLFRNLTELWIFASSKSNLKNTILNFPSLRKLRIQSDIPWLGDLLEVLKHSQIESLELFGMTTEKYTDEMFVSPMIFICMPKYISTKLNRRAICKYNNDWYKTLSISSVVELKIRRVHPSFRFNFLKSLPALRSLTIFVTNISPQGSTINHSLNSSDLISKCINKFTMSNYKNGNSFKKIWAKYPNLKVVVLKVLDTWEHSSCVSYKFVP